MNTVTRTLRALSVTRAAAVACAMLASAVANAATLVVDAAGSASFATVQSAVDAAVNGDTILIRAGTYSETLAIGGKLLTIRGDGSASAVVLRSPSGATMMHLNGGETNALRFEQLTFTGGSSDSLINIDNASPVFEHCIFRDNLRRAVLDARSCADTGGSIYRACLFLNNREPNGGAMYLSNANTVIEDCAFVNNAATGPTSGVNAGGAVYVNDWNCGQHTFTFTRCVFANNSAVWGGAIYSQGVYPNSTTQMPIANCIFAGNLASQGAAMWNWYITVPVSNSWFCGIPDQISYYWIDAGGNQNNGDCSSVPYADCNSDGVPDSLEIALGLASDCNGDGVPDVCEIASGSASDANANGVPDACEALQVPSQYPTIQAAIDSVSAGAHKVVEVAAGTYHENFALNGKDVIVRGAANNATILDGTGLTTSIARFTGGEPATAGVESLVFRNGIVGSRFTPKSTFTIGGALYGVNSAAAIRNCRFEQNTADYGAGAYLLRCTMNVVDSDFAGNTARSEGGGMLVYETTGVVSGCDFTQNLSGIAGPGSGSGFKAVGAHAAGETVLLTGCTFAGGISGVNGSAVEFFENTVSVPGILRLTGCSLTGNSSGLGAGGLRVIGGMYSCVLSGGTSICFNTTSNVDGPYLIEGSATVCDCLADLTHDGAVNGGDLGVLLSSWGLTLPSGAGDVNHDGVVNAADLGALLSSWGACQ